MTKVKEELKKAWEFFKKDSWASFLVTLVLAFILIKFMFFPLMSLATGTVLPVVIVESCSMYHSDGLEQVMENDIYKDYGLKFKHAGNWSFQNGLNKGDIVFVLGKEVDDLAVGDVIIFNGSSKHPIIHRIIEIDSDRKITTKGDHNTAFLSEEDGIDEELLMGKAVFRIPFIGWLKLIFFEWGRHPGERGLCS
ncbi:signal peptidase I [Candidatus Pacearchaeota archaeon]|nr:signal peptidase I [Candidatus Pacearchaeota archaeon]|tara:strand:+ start:4860 stop:5441 length:582 start_codon:yes stop_codon:yes gene_type:complete